MFSQLLLIIEFTDVKQIIIFVGIVWAKKYYDYLEDQSDFSMYNFLKMLKIRQFKRKKYLLQHNCIFYVNFLKQ